MDERRETDRSAQRGKEGVRERRRLCGSVGSESACLCEVCDVRQPRPSHLPAYRSLVRLTFPGSLGALLPDCSATCSPQPNGKALESRGRPPAQSLPSCPCRSCQSCQSCQVYGNARTGVCLPQELYSVRERASQSTRPDHVPSRQDLKTSTFEFNLWRPRFDVPYIRTRRGKGHSIVRRA